MPVDSRRVALVTGSSRGLGAAIARRLAKDGLAVAVNGRRGDEQADQVARSVSADGGTAGAFGAMSPAKPRSWSWSPLSRASSVRWTCW